MHNSFFYLYFSIQMKYEIFIIYFRNINKL